jgi:hypothetical protein
MVENRLPLAVAGEAIGVGEAVAAGTNNIADQDGYKRRQETGTERTCVLHGFCEARW